MPGRGKDIAGKIVNYLRQNDGIAVLNSSNVLAKNWDCTGGTINYSIHKLIRDGVIRALSPMGHGRRGRVKLEFIKDITPLGKGDRPSPKKRGRDDKKDSVELKLSLSLELVWVYEELKKTQDLATLLQTKNTMLEIKVTELQTDLESEITSQHHEANEIAQLELQLRELRDASIQGARRLVFDRRGDQI